MPTDVALRYARAVSTPRLAGAHLLIGFSPTLRRRISVFSRAAFEQWLLLEADPAVRTFCERPVVARTQEAKRVIDFWVRYDDREEFLLLGDGAEEPDTVALSDAAITLRYVAPAQLAAARIWARNWESMLPVINATLGSVRRELEDCVLRSLASPKPMMTIEREHSIGDPSVVRGCVFELLRIGRLVAPQLHTQALSMMTSFGRAT
jgi:hypothetical protein